MKTYEVEYELGMEGKILVKAEDEWEALDKCYKGEDLLREAPQVQTTQPVFNWGKPYEVSVED